MAKKTNEVDDGELAAMTTVYSALKSLNAEAQTRVLDYVMQRFSLTPLNRGNKAEFDSRSQQTEIPPDRSEKERLEADDIRADKTAEKEDAEDLEGVSPIAKKWMRRNGFNESQLSALFSLGVDEIDLVAKSVPGKNKKEKFHNVLLLQGVASYLGTGVAKIDHKSLKQATAHYGADPGGNLSSYMKDFAADVSGSYATGLTLTTRGLASATEIIKDMTTNKP